MTTLREENGSAAFPNGSQDKPVVNGVRRKLRPL